MKIAIIDFEASSLGNNSYPIEVGVAIVDLISSEISSDGFLIRPHETWTDWNEDSALIHNIPRSELFKNGLDVDEAAARLKGMVQGLPVFCDSPAFDNKWSARLFDAVGRAPGFIIHSLWDVAWRYVPDNQSADKLMGWFARITPLLRRRNPHRAEADARMLAEGILNVRDFSRVFFT